MFSILVFLVSVFAFGDGDFCPKFKSSLYALNEIPKHQCVEIRDSKQCQELYQKNVTQMDPQEANRRKLNCNKTAWSIFLDNTIPLPLRGSCLTGVGNFALEIVTSIQDSATAVATGLRKGAGYLQIEAEKATERVRKCNSDPEEKRALVVATISRWPKLMQPASIPEDVFKKDCLNVDLWLRETERQNKNKIGSQVGSKKYKLNNPLTQDEQEVVDYLDPNLNQKYQREESISIANLARELMKNFKDGATCYNSDFQTELYCESLATAASFVIPGMAALRAARIQKLATLGRSLSNAEIEILAEEALKASKIKDFAGRQGLVEKVAKLEDADRLELVKKILGRNLTKEEADAILRAHDLSTDQLLAKSRILNKVGFTAEEREIFMRTSLTGKPLTKEQLASQLQVINKLPASPNKTRLLAEVEGNSTNPDVVKMTNQFQSATEGYVKDAGSIANAEGRKLADIEYAASRWGSKATNSTEISRAESLVGSAAKARLDAEIKIEAAKASAKGYPFNQGEYVNNYIQSLRSDMGKGFSREATEFKIKAIIKEYKNVNGWNLK